MQLFINGIGAGNVEDLKPTTTTTALAPMTTRTPLVQQIVLEPAQLAACPTCPACPKPTSPWWYILIGVAGVAVGGGIAAAAIGNR